MYYVACTEQSSFNVSDLDRFNSKNQSLCLAKVIDFYTVRNIVALRSPNLGLVTNTIKEK